MEVSNTTQFSIKDFYRDLFGDCCPEIEAFLTEDNHKDIGHVNVFRIEDMYKSCGTEKPKMPYNRRNYYKISLIHGHNVVEYADKMVEIKGPALLFATPKIPYCYTPQDTLQKGFFTVFTKNFMTKDKTGLNLEDFPILDKGSDFIFTLSEEQFQTVAALFQKMTEELSSDYVYKYDLLRNYIIELLHFGQKLTPHKSQSLIHTAATRITTLFIELLERQFPIESNHQSLTLRTAKDFADTLNIHVNHLNKVLKETTHQNTSHIIANRIVQEAKLLLKQTHWNISEIAYSLGFDELSHFSSFFKKHTFQSPLAYREV